MLTKCQSGTTEVLITKNYRKAKPKMGKQIGLRVSPQFHRYTTLVNDNGICSTPSFIYDET